MRQPCDPRADLLTQKWTPRCTECEGLRKEAFRFLLLESLDDSQ